MTEKIIRESTVCPTCKRSEYNAKREITCDACGYVFAEEGLRGESRLLLIHEHYKNRDNENDCGIVNRHFCNYYCMFKYLGSVKYDEKVSIGMPYVNSSDLAKFLAAARKVHA